MHEVADQGIHALLVWPNFDPIRLLPNVIVMCSTWDRNGSLNKLNYCPKAARSMEVDKEHHFWSGFKQEYTLLDHGG